MKHGTDMGESSISLTYRSGMNGQFAVIRLQFEYRYSLRPALRVRIERNKCEDELANSMSHMILSRSWKQKPGPGIAEIRIGVRGEVVRLLAPDFLQRFAGAAPQPQLRVERKAAIRRPWIVDRPIWGDDAAPAAVDACGREPARPPEDLPGAADTAGIQVEHRMPLQAERPAVERHGVERIVIL